MNELQIVELRNRFGFVLVDDLPPPGGCNILCLSDREVHIIRRFIHPFAEWRSRFVRWLYADYYETATDAEFDDYLDEVNQLFNDVGGFDMGCTELAAALQAIASAISAGGGIGGGNITAFGGNCSGVGIPGQVAGFLGQYDNTQLLAPAPGSVVENVPPEGFDTWLEYEDYKCRAAQQVFAFVVGFCRECQGFKLLAVTATIVGPLLAGWAGVWGAIAITPAGWIAAISSLVFIATLESLAFWGFEQLGDYLDANKSSVICALYTSGDAAAARTAVAGYIEDGIQAVEWSSIGLEALGPAISALMGTVMAAVTENGVVNILFELTADLAYPDAECVCGGNNYEFHFDAGAEGWVEIYDVGSGNSGVGQWDDASEGEDPYNGSSGRLTILLTRANGNACKGGWIYEFDPYPVAVTGMAFIADMWQGSSAGLAGYTLRIQYSDNTFVDTRRDGQDNQWLETTVAVPSEQNGKSIRYIYYLADFGTQQPAGPTSFAIDNVRTTIPLP